MGVKDWVRNFYLKEKAKNAKDKVKNAGIKVGTTVKTAGQATWNKTKAVGRGARNVGQTAWVGTKAAGRGVGNVAGTTGRGIRTGTNAVGRGARATGRGIARGASAVKRGSTKVAASSKSISFLFILALIIHILDVITGFNRRDSGMAGIMFFFYIVLFLYAFVVVFEHEWSMFAVLFSLSLFSYLLPLIRSWILTIISQVISTPSAVFVDGLMVLAPVWIVYLMISHNESGLVKTFSSIYITFWLTLFIIQMYSNPLYSEIIGEQINIDKLKTEIINPYAPLGELWEIIKDTGIKIYKGAQGLPNQVSKAWTSQIAVATGDYYTGKVDENANEQLGVYLEDIQMADPEVYEDESVTVWANLKARTLNKEKPVNVSISCWKDKKKESNKGKISPEENFTIFTLEEEEVDCFFDKYELGKGSHSITFSAGFNFETMSYLKSYFMDKERKRAMRREEIDVFEQFDIKDEKPVAIYTVGPVMIGMEIRTDLPVGIDRSKNEETFVLGITLDNDWDGKIEKVTDLVIITPKYAKLIKDDVTGNYCYNYKFNETCGEENCEYKLDQAGKKIEAVEKFISLRCPVVIDKVNYEEFLGKTPLSIKYFKVTAEYDYTIEKAISVNVEEGEYRSEERKKEVKYIILHHTGSPTVESAKKTLKDRKVSVHYIIDQEGNVESLVPEERTAYGAGCCPAGNPNCCTEYACGICEDDEFYENWINHESVNIEIVNTGAESDGYEEQYGPIKELVSGIAERHDGIDKDNLEEHVKGHYEVTEQKWDPSPNFLWEEIGLPGHPTVYSIKCGHGETHALFSEGGYSYEVCPPEEPILVAESTSVEGCEAQGYRYEVKGSCENGVIGSLCENDGQCDVGSCVFRSQCYPGENCLSDAEMANYDLGFCGYETHSNCQEFRTDDNNTCYCKDCGCFVGDDTLEMIDESTWICNNIFEHIMPQLGALAPSYYVYFCESGDMSQDTFRLTYGDKSFSPNRCT